MQLLLENDNKPLFLPLPILPYFRTLANMIADFGSQFDTSVMITLQGDHQRQVVEWIIDAVALYHVGKKSIHRLEDLSKYLADPAYRELFPSSTSPPLELRSIREMTIGAKLYIIESLNYLDIPELMKLVTRSLYLELFSLTPHKMELILEKFKKWRASNQSEEMLVEEDGKDDEEEEQNLTKLYQREKSIQKFYQIALRPEFHPILIPVGKYLKRMRCTEDLLFIMKSDGLYYSTYSNGRKIERFGELLGKPLMFDLIGKWVLCLTETGLYLNDGKNPYWKNVKLPENSTEILSICTGENKFAVMTLDAIYIYQLTRELIGFNYRDVFILGSFIEMKDDIQPKYIQFQGVKSETLIILTEESMIIAEYVNFSWHQVVLNLVIKVNEEHSFENVMFADRERGLMIWRGNFRGLLSEIDIEKRSEILVGSLYNGCEVFSQITNPNYTLLWTSAGLLLQGNFINKIQQTSHFMMTNHLLTLDRKYNHQDFQAIEGYEGNILSLEATLDTTFLYTTEGIYFAGRNPFTHFQYQPEFKKIISHDLSYFHENDTCKTKTIVNVHTSVTGSGGGGIQ